MKKKVLALSAVVLLAAGIAAILLLLPRDDGVITLRPVDSGELVPVRDLSGDTGFFESISISGAETDSDPAIHLYFEPKGNRRFTYGTIEYAENVSVGGYSISGCGRAGYVQSYDGLSLVYSGELRGDSSLPIGWHPNYLHIESRTLDFDPDSRNCSIILPPPISGGNRRVTVFFRERFTVGEDENGNPLYTSGEELYSVSFALDIPEPNGEPYEVVHAVDATARGGGHPIIWLLVRRNREYGGDRELMHAAGDGIVLEKLEDGEWVTVQPPEGVSWEEPMLQYAEDGSVAHVVSYSGNGHTTPYCIALLYPEGTFDFSATYRITLPLSEYSDGGGKTYTLQFSFRFSEEASGVRSD